MDLQVFPYQNGHIFGMVWGYPDDIFSLSQSRRSSHDLCYHLLLVEKAMSASEVVREFGSRRAFCTRVCCGVQIYMKSSEILNLQGHESLEAMSGSRLALQLAQLANGILVGCIRHFSIDLDYISWRLSCKNQENWTFGLC